MDRFHPEAQLLSAASGSLLAGRDILILSGFRNFLTEPVNLTRI
jgi:hypothetical protein